MNVAFSSRGLFKIKIFDNVVSTLHTLSGSLQASDEDKSEKVFCLSVICKIKANSSEKSNELHELSFDCNKKRWTKYVALN